MTDWKTLEETRNLRHPHGTWIEADALLELRARVDELSTDLAVLTEGTMERDDAESVRTLAKRVEAMELAHSEFLHAISTDVVALQDVMVFHGLDKKATSEQACAWLRAKLEQAGVGVHGGDVSPAEPRGVSTEGARSSTTESALVVGSKECGQPMPTPASPVVCAECGHIAAIHDDPHGDGAHGGSCLEIIGKCSDGSDDFCCCSEFHHAQ